MSNYNINFRRFALLLLPTFWRRPILATMAYAAVTPVIYLRAELLTLRREAARRLNQNGQVCRMTAALNDAFDPDGRRIYISDTAPARGYLQIFHRQTGYVSVLHRGNGYVGVIHRGYVDYTPSFIVNIPSTLYNRQTEINGMVTALRLAGKTFKITTYEPKNQ